VTLRDVVVAVLALARHKIKLHLYGARDLTPRAPSEADATTRPTSNIMSSAAITTAAHESEPPT
jgi:hypothetical protein